MKILYALAMLSSLNCLAADRFALTCLVEPIMQEDSVLTFDAQAIANDAVGFKKLVIYMNNGPSRKVLVTYDVQYRQSGLDELINRENGDVVLSYKNRAAPTRNGVILIELGGRKSYLNTICYL